MNKRALIIRIGIGLFVAAAAFFLFRELKGEAIDWYAHRMYVRTAAYIGSGVPDQICLTWSADPKTTQTIQWRTAPSVENGVVEYRTKDAVAEDAKTIEADRSVIEDTLLENDPLNARFSATLEGLQPATTYVYRVGSPTTDEWSDWSEFTTAPNAAVPFSFMYLGDAQRGLGAWGLLMNKAYERHPEAAFYMVAGDLINDGGWRNEWDHFFGAAQVTFRNRPLVPVLGNHDYDYDEVPRLYTELLTLPENGPEGFPPERAYSFTYSNALFVVLDSNMPAGDQAAWLEDILSNSDATWKIAVYHHPAYPSAPHRENADVRDIWGPLFDKYHVDLALQGHDHAYLRTYPMKGGVRVKTPADGTIYIVSVSGTKFYDQIDRDYSEVAFPNVMTYQIIDITTDPDRLSYRAFDGDETIRDEFVIEK
jgi:hypothetical protein